MKIRTNLAVLSASFIILILLLAGITQRAFSNINSEIKRQNTINEVVKSILELNTLTSEYLMNPGPRAEKQWAQKYDSLSRMFLDLKREEAIEPDLLALESVYSDYDALGSIFDMMRANTGKKRDLLDGGAPKAQIDLSIEYQGILATQALMRTLRITSEIIVLSGITKQRISSVQKRTTYILLISTFGFAIFAAVVSLAVSRAIIVPIDELIRGAEVIGEGNLEHRINVKSAGEVGELAVAFNQMAVNRKRAEEEIHTLNRELERKVMERTAQLDATNRELEAFAYSVSHDLRAPLRSLNGFSQALLEEYEGRLDAQGKDFLNRIRKASQTMGRLIDDMLKLSRVTRGELSMGTVDLSSLAKQIAQKFKTEQPERQVEFVIQDGLLVQGDKNLLYTAIENLFSNAWKFTGKKAVARIEFGATLHEGRDTYFVRDNGVGFDMAYVDKLFSPFQRLHPANEFPGTGIGLATVERIIRRHGGEVWAEGETDKSATFYFWLESP